MVIKISKVAEDKETILPYMIIVDGQEDYDRLWISKDEFLDLYRQMTKLMVDEVIENYDPDKPRPGFGSSGEEHKKYTTTTVL
jgi:hypothetical protein